MKVYILYVFGYMYILIKFRSFDIILIGLYQKTASSRISFK